MRHLLLFIMGIASFLAMTGHSWGQTGETRPWAAKSLQSRNNATFHFLESDTTVGIGMGAFGYMKLAPYRLLARKQNAITLGTTAQYFRGDFSLATFPTNLSSFTNGPGYITGFTEVDGSVTNESQTLLALGATNPRIYLSTAGGAGGGTVNFQGGTGISITHPTADIIQIAATGTSGGTVTSVGITVPTGLSIVSGSPVITSGTIAIGLQTNYSIPANIDQYNWNQAYANMGKVYVGSTLANNLSTQYFQITSGSVLPRMATVASADIYLPATASDIYYSLAAKENSLGNPGTSGYVLSSTTAGVRSWVANGGGTSVHSSLSNLDYATSGHTGFAKIAGDLTQAFNASQLTIEGGTYDWVIAQNAGTLKFSQYGSNITFSGSSITAFNFIGSSDRRLKKHINHLDFSKIEQIDIKQFLFKNDPTNRRRVGVIAQEVEKVLPELVYTDSEGMKSVAYTDLILMKLAFMESKIKELQREIKTLKNEK